MNEERIKELQAKLQSSRGKAGYGERAKAIQDEIARLLAEDDGTWPIEGQP
jgi:hypothetical protein